MYNINKQVSFFMILHTSPLFSIYFGQMNDGLTAEHYAQARALHSFDYAPFEQVKKALHCQNLVFLEQTHSDNGVLVTPEFLSEYVPFGQQGDYLITATNAGVGVLTADCLPIVMYDSFHTKIGVVHAGWRGSVKRVATKALEAMQNRFGTQIEHVRFFFGPSAKVCCYQVSDDFIHELDTCSYASEVIVQRGDSYYFDLPTFNRLQLEEIGVKRDAICLEYTSCTMCHETFNSYRRQGTQAGRQMTVACLK